MYSRKKQLTEKQKTSPECNEEFVKFVKEKFNSEIFNASVKYLNVDVKNVFCYAGAWTFGVYLKNGAMVKCHNCKAEANFYENLNKLPKLLPIGNNCQIADCSLQYNFIAGNIIPEAPDTPTFGKMLDRPNLINEEVRNLLDIKYSDYHKLYSSKKQKNISKKVYDLFNKDEFLSNKNISLKNKIRYIIYKHLKTKLEKKGLV